MQRKEQQTQYVPIKGKKEGNDTMNHNSVMIKSNKYGLIVVLDDKIPFAQLLRDVADKFREASNFFKNAKMAISFSGRTLTQEQEKELVSTIVNNSHIHILCVIDERKEVEEYYRQAVEHSMEEIEKTGWSVLSGNIKSRRSIGNRKEYYYCRGC